MKHLLALLVLVTSGSLVGAQPLFDYVNAPDDSFAWEVEAVEPQAFGADLVRLKMTSQVWQGITWSHRVALIVPDNLERTDTAVLFVTGGNPDGMLLQLGGILTSQLGVVLAVLGDIPNQPLYGGLTEDALIAYTFVKWMETQDDTWPLLFPMTKSAVRAMDAVQEYCRQERQHDVTGFVVSGASKRGWTTWLAGAVDPRVIGIAPIVYDNLNLNAQMAQQIAMYGSYSAEIEDYTKYDLQGQLATPTGQRLAEMIDPYTFRAGYEMPKLIICGVNDPYWTLESANLYIGDLPRPTAIIYSPNGGHDLGGVQPVMTRIVPTLLAFVDHCATRADWPDVAWDWSEGDEGLTLTVSSDIPADGVALWTATSPTTDFRQATWSQGQAGGSGTKWVLTVPRPESGYGAGFADVTYTVGGRTFTLCTTPRMVGP